MCDDLDAHTRPDTFTRRDPFAWAEQPRLVPSRLDCSRERRAVCPAFGHHRDKDDPSIWVEAPAQFAHESADAMRRQLVSEITGTSVVCLGLHRLSFCVALVEVNPRVRPMGSPSHRADARGFSGCDHEKTPPQKRARAARRPPCAYDLLSLTHRLLQAAGAYSLGSHSDLALPDKAAKVADLRARIKRAEPVEIRPR